MYQPETKSWDNVPFKTWKYEPQTEMKHKVFSYYLPLWLQILSRYNRRLNYVDGFGGIGAYHNRSDLDIGQYSSNNFGSPIISLQAIKSLTTEGKISETKILIIDENEANLINIREIIDHLQLDLPGNITFTHSDFDEKINELLDQNEELAPTFFLLDPFGIRGIKLSTIERIMSYEKTEILLNFMYNTIQRWIEHPNERVNIIYNDLFGSVAWRQSSQMNRSEKEKFLVELFKSQCKKFSKCVYPFRLKFPDRDQTYYYLFHLTNHWLGCARMKDSFARFNMGRTEYSGVVNNQVEIFERNEREQESEQLSNKIKSVLHKKDRLTFSHLMEIIIDDTNLLEREIKLLVGQMEDTIISVLPYDNRKRRGGLKNDDIITLR